MTPKMRYPAEMTTDSRQAAAAKVAELIALLKTQEGPETGGVIEECNALARAIGAFHMEGIRFRIYNVDRLVVKHAAAMPPGVSGLIEEVRHHLEAAGFHTRSHQAPG
jgi:hypothetical protein